MQLFISLLISFNFFFVSKSNVEIISSIENDPTVQIEIQDAENIPFDFSMTFEQKRKIIKIRSAVPIKSLRTVDSSTNSHKGYNVFGSDLIILPLRDFDLGSHVAELKFQNNSTVVLAKIHIVENPVASGE